MERKSETQKKIEGTARKDRQIKFNSSKLEQLPKPPLTLDRHTKKIFNSILKHLNEKGALMQIDVYTVCSASIWYRVLFHYQKLVLESINDPDPKKDILIQKFKGGASNVSAEFTVLKQAQKQCDDYFWNAHRNEARGIGGLFFDRCSETEEMSMEQWYDFVTEVGNSFLNSYVPIVEKRKNLAYTEAQRNWQELRRGRYVEFNLIHDKGTLFGLKTNGRIESILMSLPPHVQWQYNHQPEKGSEEERLLIILEEPKNWV